MLHNWVFVVQTSEPARGRRKPPHPFHSSGVTKHKEKDSAGLRQRQLQLWKFKLPLEMSSLQFDKKLQQNLHSSLENTSSHYRIAPRRKEGWCQFRIQRITPPFVFLKENSKAITNSSVWCHLHAHMSCSAPEQRCDLAQGTVHREVHTQRRCISTKAGDLRLRAEQELYQGPFYFRLGVKNMKEISTVSTEGRSALHGKITLYMAPR